jgi:hypothetical protein
MRSRPGIWICLALACGKPQSTDSGTADEGTDDTQSGSDSRIDGVFNEFLSVNDTSNTDESGEYDDWLELANPTGQPLDLSGYGLTDGLAAGEAQWTIPAGTVVLPGNLLLIWCDEDEDQGSLHASFKLSANGETVSLLDSNGELVDEIEIPALPVDTSWARAFSGQWGEAPPSPESPNP